MHRFRKGHVIMGAAGLAVLLFMAGGALVLSAADNLERGFLGVSVQRLGDAERAELGVKHGVEVVGVEKESAAARAGIRAGDVIQLLNGEKVRDPQTMVEIVAEMSAGSAVNIGLWREGKALELKATLGKYERPGCRADGMRRLHKAFCSGPYLGVNIVDLDDGDLAAYFNVKTAGGVLVTAVEKATPAAKAGLKAGDVIVRVDKRAVNDSGDIREALAELKKGDIVAIAVMRRGKQEILKAAPDFGRCCHRVLGGVMGGECRMPCAPDAPDFEHVMKRVHEKMDKAMIRVNRCLREIDDNRWI